MAPNSVPLEHELIHDIIDTVELSELQIAQAVDCINRILRISSNIRLYGSVKLPLDKIGRPIHRFLFFSGVI